MSTAPRGMATLFSLKTQTLTGDGRTVSTPCDGRAGAGASGTASIEGGLGFSRLPRI
jgi:hypothetical protein